MSRERVNVVVFFERKAWKENSSFCVFLREAGQSISNAHEKPAKRENKEEWRNCIIPCKRETEGQDLIAQILSFSLGARAMSS